jgi:hypothetical protein
MYRLQTYGKTDTFYCPRKETVRRELAGPKVKIFDEIFFFNLVPPLSFICLKFIGSKKVYKKLAFSNQMFCPPLLISS